MKRLLLVSFISLSAVTFASAQTGKTLPRTKHAVPAAVPNQKTVLLKKQQLANPAKTEQNSPALLPPSLMPAAKN